MHQFSMTYSKEKAFKRKSARLTLEKKVKELESRIRCNSDEALVEQYNKSKNESENLYNYITEGIILRSNIGEIHYHKGNKTNGGKQIEFNAESNQFERKIKSRNK